MEDDDFDNEPAEEDELDAHERNELDRDDENGDVIDDEDTDEDPAEREERLDAADRERAIERHDPFDCD